jgi:5-methylcytosine-specific restriction endonuclease McrA
MGLSKERYQERLRQGLCPTCGRPRDGETVQCGKCKDKWAENRRSYYSRRKKRGLCRTCPTKIEKGTYCEPCLKSMGEQTRRLHEDRRSRGACMWCEAPRAVGRFCEQCWFDSIALRVMGSKSYGADLRTLFTDQSRRCFYTNEVLTPGSNTALDHQIPRSLGGRSSIDNLRWTTIQINRVKNDLSHDDFIHLCSMIAKKFCP